MHRGEAQALLVARERVQKEMNELASKIAAAPERDPALAEAYRKACARLTAINTAQWSAEAESRLNETVGPVPPR